MKKKNPVYLFPNNIKKIADNKEKNILKNINNIDFIFKKYYKYLKLSDCILFRRIGTFSHNDENKDFKRLFSKMIKYNKYNKYNKYKNKEELFDKTNE